MDNSFLKAFAEVIREQIARKKVVEIEGLGVFRVEHQKQFQKQYNNGRVVMMPPENSIVFSPENNKR